MPIKLKKLFSKKKKLLGENHRDFGKNIVLDESGFVKRETFSSLISEVSSFLERSSKYLKEEEILAFKKFLEFLKKNEKKAPGNKKVEEKRNKNNPAVQRHHRGFDDRDSNFLQKIPEFF